MSKKDDESKGTFWFCICCLMAVPAGVGLAVIYGWLFQFLMKLVVVCV